MNPQQIDKRLFELCKPEGVYLDSSGRCYGPRSGEDWSPSTDWRRLESLIRKACGDNRWFQCEYDKANGWLAHFDTLWTPDDEVKHSKGSTLCEAASLALIALLEEKR